MHVKKDMSRKRSKQRVHEHMTNWFIYSKALIGNQLRILCERMGINISTTKLEDKRSTKDPPYTQQEECWNLDTGAKHTVSINNDSGVKYISMSSSGPILIKCGVTYSVVVNCCYLQNMIYICI